MPAIEIPNIPTRAPRIAAIGVAAWNPSIGAGVPGGSTVNAAMTTARLGASVAIRALVGADEPGARIRAALDEAGVDTAWLTEADDRPTALETRNGPASRPGALLVRGDRIDIPALFGHDVVLLDVDDPPLRRFLLDLPAHTLPGARLLGTLAYLNDAELPDAFDMVMRHDAVVGVANELISITGAVDLDGAIEAVRARMRGENLRTVILSPGAAGSLAFTIDERWESPSVPVTAGDAFAGAVAFGMACRWDWGLVLRFANVVAGRSAPSDGRPASPPTWDQAIAQMTVEP